MIAALCSRRVRALLVVVLLVPRLAAADAQAEAVALFDQGIKDLKAGNYAKACPELAESNAKYPDSGTKGSLALCYTSLGKVASAWLLWRELADTAPPKLRPDAAKKAEKLAPRVPHFVIKAAATPGLVITVNGNPVDPKLGVPEPVDPGPLAVVATAAGHDRWTHDYTAAEGQTVAIEVPVLAPTVIKHDEPPPPIVTDDHAAARHRRHVIALGVGLVGGAALAGGTVFGLMARSDYNDAKRVCGGMIDNCPVGQVAASQKHVDDARSAATVSTVMFAAGGAAVVTGVILWVTAPKLVEEHRVTIAPQLGAGGLGVAISGGF